MSSTPVSLEVLGQTSTTANLKTSLERFDPKLARPFIYHSLSEETRAAYHGAISEFFSFVGQVHPKHLTTTDVIAYRDYLRIQKRRKANTVATKLAIVRSFFEYLRAPWHHSAQSGRDQIGDTTGIANRTPREGH